MPPSSLYTGLNRAQVMALALELEKREVCTALHDYIDNVRMLIAGDNPIVVPESHRALTVGENHEGGLALDERIGQGAAWLASGEFRFSVAAADFGGREAAQKQEDFARHGEKRLGRGKGLHRWRQESARDFFECGVSVLQHHPDAGYYNATTPERMKSGARLEEVFWRRRVDPRQWYWAEDNRGRLGASGVLGRREAGPLARMSDPDSFARLANYFDWAETPVDEYRTTAGVGKTVLVTELLLPDRGYLIVRDAPNTKRPSGRDRSLATDNPDRIVASWRHYGSVPHYVSMTGKWPPVSPLDRMVQLTPKRDWYATMLDYMDAGAAFRHWQLVNDVTGESLADAIWRDTTPLHVLLDLSKPPPNMGPGTKWELAPFEFVNLLPRYLQIKEDHEAAGQSVARLMGQMVGPHTPVGTADQIEEYARREFSDEIDAEAGRMQEIWEDTFRYIRDHHRDRIVVAARTRADPVRDESTEFFTQTLDISAEDVVSEDVEVTLDTRSFLAKIRDYTLGRTMQNAGDIGYDRRVEQGAVIWVDDAKREKGAIFVDAAENVLLEQEAESLVVERAQVAGTPPPQAPVGVNITRGSRSDPRGTGTGAGADNVANTSLQPGSEQMRMGA